MNSDSLVVCGTPVLKKYADQSSHHGSGSSDTHAIDPHHLMKTVRTLLQGKDLSWPAEIRPFLIAQFLQSDGIIDCLIPAELFASLVNQAGKNLKELTLPKQCADTSEKIQKILAVCQLPSVTVPTVRGYGDLLQQLLYFSNAGNTISELLAHPGATPTVTTSDRLASDLQSTVLTIDEFKALTPGDRYKLGRLLDLGFVEEFRLASDSDDEGELITKENFYRTGGPWGRLQLGLAYEQHADTLAASSDADAKQYYENAAQAYGDSVDYVGMFLGMIKLVKLFTDEKEQEISERFLESAGIWLERVKDITTHGADIITHMGHLARHDKLYPTYAADILLLLGECKSSTGYASAPLKAALSVLAGVANFEALADSHALEAWREAFSKLGIRQKTLIADLGDMWFITRHSPQLLVDCARILYGGDAPSDAQLKSCEHALKQESSLYQAQIAKLKLESAPPMSAAEQLEADRKLVIGSVIIPDPKKASGSIAGTEIDIKGCITNRNEHLTLLKQCWAEYAETHAIVEEINAAAALKAEAKISSPIISGDGGPPPAPPAPSLVSGPPPAPPPPSLVSGPPPAPPAPSLGGGPPPAPPPPSSGVAPSNDLAASTVLESTTLDPDDVKDILKIVKAKSSLLTQQNAFIKQFLGAWPLESEPTFELLEAAMTAAKEQLATQIQTYERVSAAGNFSTWLMVMQETWGAYDELASLFQYGNVLTEWGDSNEFQKWIQVSAMTDDEDWESSLALVLDRASKASASGAKKKPLGTPEQRRARDLKKLLSQVQDTSDQYSGLVSANRRLHRRRNSISQTININIAKIKEDKSLADTLGPRIEADLATKERLDEQYETREKSIASKEQTIGRNIRQINRFLDTEPPIKDLSVLKAAVTEECRLLESGEKLLPKPKAKPVAGKGDRVTLTPMRARNVEAASSNAGILTHGVSLKHVDSGEISEENITMLRLGKYNEIAGLQKNVSLKTAANQAISDATRALEAAIRAAAEDDGKGKGASVSTRKQELESAQDLLAAWEQAEAFHQYFIDNAHDLRVPSADKDPLAAAFIDRWQARVHAAVNKELGITE